jgi:hypothetical protein
MRVLIDSLRLASATADSILARAEHAGMQVSQAQFDLNQANTSLISARAAVHSFSVDSVRTQVDAGLEIAGQAHVRGERAMADLQFRRMGLAISAVIIVALIVGLMLKIRQVEAKPQPE